MYVDFGFYSANLPIAGLNNELAWDANSLGICESLKGGSTFNRATYNVAGVESRMDN
jgi:hypothetical protein